MVTTGASALAFPFFGMVHSFFPSSLAFQFVARIFGLVVFYVGFQFITAGSFEGAFFWLLQFS